MWRVQAQENRGTKDKIKTVLEVFREYGRGGSFGVF
jgi:hypothetical protein